MWLGIDICVITFSKAAFIVYRVDKKKLLAKKNDVEIDFAD